MSATDGRTRFQRMIEGWISGAVELAPIGKLVGFRFTGFENGEIRVELDAGPRHHNPMGIVHGGIYCDIADAAMGVAFAATLADGESFATLQLQASYLRSIKEGRLVATGRVVHRGRTVGHTECDIVDGDGRPVARFTSVCAVLRPEGGAPR
jgi:uncharacterized protein (TIGR00369 family)